MIIFIDVLYEIYLYIKLSKKDWLIRINNLNYTLTSRERVDVIIGVGVVSGVIVVKQKVFWTSPPTEHSLPVPVHLCIDDDLLMYDIPVPVTYVDYSE